VTGTDPVQHVNDRARSEGWLTRADETLSFKRPELVKVAGIWKDLATPGRLPARSDFKARTLKPYLRNLIIMELIGQPPHRRYIHRNVGTEITQRLGELTSVALDDIPNSGAVEQWSAFLNAIVESRRALRLVTRSYLGPENRLSAELFAAPLASDGLAPDRVMMVAYFIAADDTDLSAAIREL
jgi:hypothetical protein